MKPNNFTASQFIPFIPIKKRTFSSIKLRHGQEVLREIKELLTSNKPRKGKKRLFYDGFPTIDENLKDIIWDAYVEEQMRIEEENETK